MCLEVNLQRGVCACFFRVAVVAGAVLLCKLVRSIQPFLLLVVLGHAGWQGRNVLGMIYEAQRTIKMKPREYRSMYARWLSC